MIRLCVGFGRCFGTIKLGVMEGIGKKSKNGRKKYSCNE